MKNKTVELQNCSLKFPRRIMGIKSFFENNKKEEFQALKNINLNFYNGDRIGLIGINGSGKSTLLRVISKIFVPTSGYAKIYGNVFSLFNFGAGLDVELTGKENLYRIAILRGIDTKLVDENLNLLEDFCELGNFFYEPVYTYSAGMRIRIGISLLNLYTPGILTFDEGIGAGDAFFVQKAQKLVRKTLEKTNALFLASHSENLIKTFCNKAVLLHHGSVIFFGDVESSFKEYKKIREKV